MTPHGPARRRLAVSTRGLVKRYGKVDALRGVDLRVPEGAVYLLAGSRARRWLAGILIGFVFIRLADDDMVDLGGAATRIDGVFLALLEGPHGATALVLPAEAVGVATAAGEQVGVWSGPPTPEGYALTTLIWAGVAAACLAAVLAGSRKG